MNQKLLITGDIHGDFGALNKIITKKSPSYCIVCGDSAYFWAGEHQKCKIKPNNTKIYLLPGNHEDWNLFEKIIGRNGPDPIEIEPNIFYCPIGSSTIINNKTFLFIGGADSIDKQWRTAGISWFSQEVLNEKDLEYIVSRNIKADVIFSHTCPFIFNIFDKLGIYDKLYDPTSRLLDIVWEQFKPKNWFFAHFHGYAQGRCGKTDWKCLNCVPNTKWWVEIFI
jgi:hypothetical protein